LILVAASTKSRKVIGIVQKYLSNISLSTQHQTPAPPAPTNPETTANLSNPIQTRSSSRRVAANAPLDFTNLATTASDSAVLIGKPCPGRMAGSVQLAGISLVAIV
jgi:hypothetical protein